MRRLLAAFALSIALAVGLAPGLALAEDGNLAAPSADGIAKLSIQSSSTDQWVMVGSTPTRYFDNTGYYKYYWNSTGSDYVQFEQRYSNDRAAAIAGSSDLFCECSEPPSVIDAGSEVTLDTRLWAKNVSGYGQYLEYSVVLCESGLSRDELNKRGSDGFRDSEGESRFQIGTSDYSEQTHALSKTFPKAGEGPSEMSIYLYTSGGGVYEWKYKLYEAQKASLSGAKVTLANASAAFTGYTIKPSVKSVVLDGKTLNAGTDYTVRAEDGVQVGSYEVMVTGKGSYEGTATATFKITKAANKLAKTKVTKTCKAKSLKKKAATIALPTAKFGKATWKVAAKDKKKALTLTKAGKVKVKKGAKASTYTIKLKANVKGTKNYKALKNKVVTVKVKVK